MTRCLHRLFFREIAGRTREIVIRRPRPWFRTLLSLCTR